MCFSQMPYSGSQLTEAFQNHPVSFTVPVARPPEPWRADTQRREALHRGIALSHAKNSGSDLPFEFTAAFQGVVLATPGGDNSQKAVKMIEWPGTLKCPLKTLNQLCLPPAFSPKSEHVEVFQIASPRSRTMVFLWEAGNLRPSRSLAPMCFPSELTQVTPFHILLTN